jgi:bifunctional DNA-binding transcriptional regulator/antitoxin component of YhaV-PrlF toxin-antitoxin module
MPTKKAISEPCKVDEQGRTFLPKEVRQALGILGKGYVVYEADGPDVRVRKVEWVAK